LRLALHLALALRLALHLALALRLAKHLIKQKNLFFVLLNFLF